MENILNLPAEFEREFEELRGKIVRLEETEANLTATLVRLSHLQAITASLSRALTVQEVTEEVMKQAAEVLGASNCYLAMLSPDGSYLEEKGTYGYSASWVENWKMLPLNASMPLTEAVRTGEPIWLGNLQEGKGRYPILETVSNVTDNSAWATLPLVVNEKVTGGILFAFKEPQAFSEPDRQFMLTLSQHCAQALERARLYEVEREAREEAEKSRQVREAILGSITDAFVAFDRHWRYTYVNPRAEQMLGRNKEELLGKNVWETFPHVKDTPIYQTCLEMMEKRRPEVTEYYSPVAKVWLRVHFYPFLDGLSMFYNDISEQRRAEQERTEALAELEQERSRLLEVLRQMPSGVILAEAPSGKMVMGNSRVEEIFKERMPTPEEFQEYRGFKGFHPDGRPYENDEWPLARAISTGEEIKGEEIAIERGDGTRGSVLVNAGPVRNSQGEINAAVASITDISELKRVEQQHRFLAEIGRVLSSSLDPNAILQELVRQIVPAVAEGCCIDLVEDNNSLNRVAVAHRQPEKEALLVEIAGRYLVNTAPDHPIVESMNRGEPVILSSINEDLLSGLLHNPEHEAALSRVEIRSAIVLPLTARGQIRAVVSIISSVPAAFTEKDFIFAKAIAGRASLALDNAALYQEAQKNVVAQMELDRLKDTLISIAGHELRTPLTSIRGYAQLQQRALSRIKARPDGKLQPGELEKLNLAFKTIQEQSEKLEGLVRELLEFSRLGERRLELSYTPQVDVVALAQEVVEQHRAANPGRPILFASPESFLQVDCDMARIEQVLNNLINNALKYSDPVSPVMVGLRQDNDHVLVWVRDQGNGITPEHLPHLFERYYRARTQDNRHVEGLGLGLYISHEIIEKHSGKIWAESTPGEGSTFYFTIPLF